MICKFRADHLSAPVPNHLFPGCLFTDLPCTGRIRGAAACAVLALLGALAGPVQAERADRSKPMIIEADRSGAIDLQRQVLVYAGKVVIAQGTMVLRAETVEMRETPEGYRAASAVGTPGTQATWRQKRDGVDETVEGRADRIEFDGRADTLRLIGNSVVRRLRGAEVADEITGDVIVWDNVAEVFSVQGGTRSVTNPSGRVRAVLSPRVDAAATPVAPAASSPGLRPSRSLGGGKP
jgi:lipopolysaccharide export system protein LptA